MSESPEQDSYAVLAEHWSDVVWGWMDHLPENGLFQRMLRENFSPEEACALSEIRLGPIPLEFLTLDEIAAQSTCPRDRLEVILDGIVERGLLLAHATPDGHKSYALLKSSFGFPQVFYWKGEHTPHNRKMTELQRDKQLVLAQQALHTTVNTKAFRYIPTSEAIDPNWQNVYPSETIEKVLRNASKFALAHCPCRMIYIQARGESCGHSTDVCLKLDDLAESLIDAGLAREITLDEALEVIKKADREGLVHFTDNTGSGIKHICNCCGDACWNVRPIRLRRVPRDMLMATYFLRQTDEDECIACETCVEACPVAAVKIEDGVARVDTEWCIGCGVCVPQCASGAIKLVEKPNPPAMSVDFVDLHTKIHIERVAVRGKKDAATRSTS